MNAIPTQPPESEEDRAERQLRQCKRLAALGCELAEAAALLSKTDLAQQLEAQTNADPESPEEPPQPQRRADPGFLFVRLSRAVRQAIALENRIVDDVKSARANAPPRPDARRLPLQRSLSQATRGHADLQFGLSVRIDEMLDTDPDANIPIETLLQNLIAQLGLPPDTPTKPQEPEHCEFKEPKPRSTSNLTERVGNKWPWELPEKPPDPA